MPASSEESQRLNATCEVTTFQLFSVASTLTVGKPRLAWKSSVVEGRWNCCAMSLPEPRPDWYTAACVMAMTASGACGVRGACSG